MSDEITKYYLFDVKTGSPPEGFGKNPDVMSPVIPKIGEYLNHSGCYLKVITLLHKFDANYLEVFVEIVGGSEDFLTRIQAELQASSSS